MWCLEVMSKEGEAEMRLNHECQCVQAAGSRQPACLGTARNKMRKERRLHVTCRKAQAMAFSDFARGSSCHDGCFAPPESCLVCIVGQEDKPDVMSQMPRIKGRSEPGSCLPKLPTFSNSI